MAEQPVFKVSELLGKHYNEMFTTKKRYVVIKGSRASKKTTNQETKIAIFTMSLEGLNTLICRKVHKTLRDSVFSDMEGCLNRLGVLHLWKINHSRLEMVYKPNGNKIYFRGLDKPEKLKGIKPAQGHLCWCWIEEAYELLSYDAFRIVENSFRDILPPHLYFQFTFTFNPVTPFWIKDYFFDRCDPALPTYDEEFAKNCLCMTTTYKMNEWVAPEFIEAMEDLKKNNPRAYEVDGLGNWGVSGDAIYTNWHVFDKPPKYIHELRRNYPNAVDISGLDFGYVNQTAYVSILLDKKSRKIWVYEEFCAKNYTNDMIMDKLRAAPYNAQNRLIIADSAELKSINDFIDKGFYRVYAARKGADSVVNGIDYVRRFELNIFKHCINTLTQVANYGWDKDPETGLSLDPPKPIKVNDHCCDALRYAATYTQTLRELHDATVWDV